MTSTAFTTAVGSTIAGAVAVLVDEHPCTAFRQTRKTPKISFEDRRRVAVAMTSSFHGRALHGPCQAGRDRRGPLGAVEAPQRVSGTRTGVRCPADVPSASSDEPVFVQLFD